MKKKDKNHHLNSTIALNSIQKSIREWNLRYPLDKWYRDKFNIRYNSKEHVETDIIDIRIMFEEDVMYRKALIDASQSNKNTYLPGRGKWLKEQPKNNDPSKEEIIEIYDRVDLKDFKEDPDEIEL